MPMQRFLFILTTPFLAFLLTSCSGFESKNPSNNLTEKPLNLATKAYKLVGDAHKTSVTYDLERAYIKNGTAQIAIDRLLNKQDKSKTSNAKDSDLDSQAKRALEEKKPNFKKALTAARAIKKPDSKSEILLRIAEKLPKDQRLQVLKEAEKSIAEIKPSKSVYQKRDKLLKLAKLYIESGDKKSARKTLLSSHKLLIRNTSSLNAFDFGKVAELESQLGVKPENLCKLTRYLHKTKDQPIALARITAAYLNHGYQGQMCIPDKKLIMAVSNMPDAGRRVREQLTLAEAWHGRKERNKSKQLYKDAIKSVKAIDRRKSRYKFDLQGKVMVSLLKTNHTKLYSSVSADFWKQINKIERPYQQSEALMQFNLDAYVGGLPDLSLDVLRKMKDHSLKVTSGVALARMAHKKDDQAVVKKVLTEVFSAAKTTPHPVSKMDWLREVTDTAYDLGYNEIVTQALTIAVNSVGKVSHPDLKVMYGLLITNKAWENKDYDLAEGQLKKSQLWYEDWLKKTKNSKEGACNTIDYLQESKNRTLINIIKANVLLGENVNALALLERLPSRESQAKAMVYMAIALADKRKQQGVSKKDETLMNTLEKNIQRLSQSAVLKNKNVRRTFPITTNSCVT